MFFLLLVVYMSQQVAQESARGRVNRNKFKAKTGLLNHKKILIKIKTDIAKLSHLPLLVGYVVWFGIVCFIHFSPYLGCLCLRLVWRWNTCVPGHLLHRARALSRTVKIIFWVVTNQVSYGKDHLSTCDRLGLCTELFMVCANPNHTLTQPLVFTRLAMRYSAVAWWKETGAGGDTGGGRGCSSPPTFSSGGRAPPLFRFGFTFLNFFVTWILKVDFQGDASLS